MIILTLMLFITNIILLTALFREYEYHRIDPLTGVLNRKAFEEDFYEKKYVRSSDPKYLIIIDINDFKIINDTGGHLAGDRYLRHVARLIKNMIRKDVDKLYRIGGDEFAVLTNYKSVLDQVNANISYGITEITNNKKLNFKLADKNMYIHKAQVKHA